MKFIDNVEMNSYKNFADNHKKSHFLQSYEWGQFCKKAKNQIPHYVGLVDDNGVLVATALILEKKTPLGYSYGYCPRGFIADYDNKEVIKEFTFCLKKHMKENKYIYIKFDPDIPYHDIDDAGLPIKGGKNNYPLFDYMTSLGYKHTGFYKLYEGNQPRYTFRINLKKDWKEIESKMSKSFIKSVKRSEQYDFLISHDFNPDIFYKLMINNSTKDDFNPKSLEYYQIFTEEMQKGNNVKYFNISIEPKKLLTRINTELKLLNEQLLTTSKKIEDIKNQIARLEKEKKVFENIMEDKICICSLICTYTKNRAWSLFIGSDEIANLAFAVVRSYYEAIKDAYNNGYDFFDLFGTTGDPNTNYKNLAKLHDFKRKFGDEYIEFIGEFDLINNKVLYKLLPIMLKVYRKIRR